MHVDLASPKKTGATVPNRALEMRSGDIPPEGARFLLGLGIGEEDRERMLELLAEQQRGPITPGERRAGVGPRGR